MVELLGTIGLLLAGVGTMLNNHRRIECFPVWLASNIFFGAAHYVVGVWSLVLCNALFFVLAIDGWRRWRTK